MEGCVHYRVKASTSIVQVIMEVPFTSVLREKYIHLLPHSDLIRLPLSY